MSDNTSEIDEITRSTSRLSIQIMQLIRTWRTMNPTATRVPRSVRREINHAIKTDAKEQQFAHAQERVRMQRAVIEYRWKLVQDRAIRPWDTQNTWFERQRDLAVAHERLRTGIYNTAHLTATERGQVSQAIDTIHRNPNTPTTPVFGKTNGLGALRAKLADGITRLRTGLAGPAEQRRLQQWSDLHAERVAQAAQQRQRPDWLVTPDPDQPIPFVPADYPGLHRDPASGVPRPVTLRDLTKRIGRYSELRFGPDDRPATPEDMVAYDRRASEYRDVLIADAHMLGAEQAELMATALNNIDLAYGIRLEGQALQRDDLTASSVDRSANTGDAAVRTREARHEQAVQDRGYEVIVGTAEFLRAHPEMADRGIVTTMSEGYRWALNQLDDDRHGWPADAELDVRIYRPGDEQPVYSATGPRGMVVDEVTAARVEHDRTPLAEVEQLWAELHAAHAENNQLRTENTDLVRKFAEHDISPTDVPVMPAPGPKLARPIFHGPVLNRPAMNGMDR